MWQVTENIFLGQASDSRDLDKLRAAGITHILNCAAELPCVHATEFTYLHLKLKDPDFAFATAIPTACSFLDDVTSPGAVLVHCQGAISRSPSVVLAYLCHAGKTLPEAVSHLSRVIRTKPNRIFLDAISVYYRWGVSEIELESLELQLMSSDRD